MSWWRGLLGWSDAGSQFSLHRYKSYTAYSEAQISGNRRKIGLTWADEPTIHFIADHLKRRVKPLRRGLCHGVRRGNEQKWFSERLGIEVLGTDISDTATEFPNTVRWDFHEHNPEWLGSFDFVYTNSHDHAYDPKKAIDAWVDQLTDGGVLVLEHSAEHSTGKSTKLDPFRATAEFLPYLVLQWGEGRYAVAEMVQHTKANGMKVWIFFIRKTYAS